MPNVLVHDHFLRWPGNTDRRPHPEQNREVSMKKARKRIDWVAWLMVIGFVALTAAFSPIW